LISFSVGLSKKNGGGGITVRNFFYIHDHFLANGENSCPLRNVTNYMGTLRKVKGVHPLMIRVFGYYGIYVWGKFSNNLRKLMGVHEKGLPHLLWKNKED